MRPCCRHLWTVVVTVVSCLTWMAIPCPGETIRVAAAISLKEALDTIAEPYAAESGNRVEFTFGSSGQLLAQIKNGAPIDVFIAAADRQVDELIDVRLAAASTRRVIAGNALVLIVPPDAPDAPDAPHKSRAPASFADLS